MLALKLTCSMNCRFLWVLMLALKTLLFSMNLLYLHVRWFFMCCKFVQLCFVTYFFFWFICFLHYPCVFIFWAGPGSCRWQMWKIFSFGSWCRCSPCYGWYSNRVNPSFGSKLYLVKLALSRRVKLRDPEVITLRMNTRNNPSDFVREECFICN